MASGDSLLVFTPHHNEPPASSYATLDSRNSHPVLDFDGGSNEEAVFSAVMPQSYAGTTGITVIIHFSSDDTGDDVDWDVAFERVTGLDTDGDSFAAANSVDGTSNNATSGIPATASVAFTDGADMDSVAAGDEFRMKVTRDAASDASTVDANLRKVEIRET